MTHNLIKRYIIRPLGASGVLFLLTLLMVNASWAQVIKSGNRITIPEVGDTKVFGPGEKVTYKSAVGIDILPSTTFEQGSDVILEIEPDVEGLMMNWRLTRVFGPGGDVTGLAKAYYDKKGMLLQQQQLNLSTGLVLATQTIHDFLDRPAITTLLAPTGKSTIEYKSEFVLNSGGGDYDAYSFDDAKLTTPDPVGNTVPGTLGWYYSNNNNLEPYVVATGYPYARTEYNIDGSGEIKRSAGPGEAFRLGSGHETQSFRCGVVSELDHYLEVRNKYFAEKELGGLPAGISQNCIQVINRNAEGKEVITISDQYGKTLMSALPGNELTINNFSYLPNGVYYFKLFAPTSVTYEGTYSIKVYDVTASDKEVNLGVLPAGNYKVVHPAARNGVKLSYSVGLGEISYNFYNQLGQLVATIPPEGVKKLLNGGINNYASRLDIPFISLMEYDLKGRLRAVTNKEQGRTEMVYRKDGTLRFSQNAVQRQTGAYLYSNFDKWGKLSETGEFQPAGGVAFNVNGMGIEEDVSSTGGLGNGTKSYWVKSVYDIAQPTGLAGYVQDDITLSGGVSYSENNSGNKTWYNYDEQGRLLWQVQEIAGLGKKTIDYSYDALGKLTKVVFQKNVPAETFVHYYEYDADRRLLAVYTNTADNAATRIQQAKYYYYLHGPLKRVELGNKVQGIDYIYTAQGQLKSINHASSSLDPGKDGFAGANAGFAKDAFGMSLEYYNGDYTRANTGIQSIPLSSDVAVDQFAGNIKAMGWFSRKPQSVIAAQGTSVENPTMYGYKYDNKYQLNAAIWGTPNYTVPGFAPNDAFKEYNLNYDAHGNIKALARTNGAGSLTDNLVYNYPDGSNQLTSVSNGGAAYSSYAYNALGQLTTETPAGSPVRYIRYAADGKISGVYGDAAFTQPKVTFTYNERGQRVAKQDYVNNTTTYYVPGAGGAPMAIYSQVGTGAITQSEVPLYAGSRIGVYRRGSGLSEYELTDHLSNVRAVIDQNLSIKSYADYYPFGSIARDGGASDYRYGYQGQYSEKDKETGWNSFELRMYDAKIGRWLSPDPAGQFNSPYIGMGNNPVSCVDPDGGYSWFGAHWRAFFWGGHVTEFKVNGEYGVTYGGFRVDDNHTYTSRTQFSGERELYGEAQKQAYLDGLKEREFWEKEIASGRAKVTDSKLDALGSWAAFALPVGKLATAGEVVMAAEGSGVAITEGKAIAAEAAAEANAAAKAATWESTIADELAHLNKTESSSAGYGLDCSDMAASLNRAHQGGYILEITPKAGKWMNGIEYGLNAEFMYHQVFIKGKFVYDPMFGRTPIKTGDYLKIYQELNPNGLNLLRK